MSICRRLHRIGSGVVDRKYRPAILESLENRRLFAVGTLLGATQNLGNTIGPDVADPVRDVAYFVDQGTNNIVAVNTDTGQTAGVVKASANVAGLAVSVDDTRLYASEPGAFQIEVFSLPTMTLLKTLNVGVAVQQIVAISNDRLIGDIGSIEGFDAETGASLFNMAGDYDGLLRTNLAGTMFYSRARGLSGNDGGIRVWDVSGATPSSLASIPGPTGMNSTDFAVDPVNGKAYMEDGGAYGIEVTLLSTGNKTLWGFVNGGGPGAGVAALPGGQFVYATTFFGNVEQFNQSGVATATLGIPNPNASSLVITPNGNLLYTSGPTVGVVGISTLNISEVPHLVFQTQPSNILLGNAINPSVVVDIEDPGNNIITGDKSSVTLAIVGPTGNLIGTSMVSAQNGVATFTNLSLTLPDTYILQATDGTDTSAMSNSFNIGVPHLVFLQPPTNTFAGAAISPAVSVAIEDDNGNILTGGNSTMSLEVHNSLGNITQVLSAQAQNGVATFANVLINQAGSYTLQANDGNDSPATSGMFDVIPVVNTPPPTTPVKLAMVRQPSNVQVNGIINPSIIVQVDDIHGNVVTTNSSQVTVSIWTGPRGATLAGTLTQTAVNGVATFNDLSVNLQGPYILTFSDGALRKTFSTRFVASGHLAWAQAPTDAIAGNAISPGITVDIDDANGNPVANGRALIVLRLTSGPARGPMFGARIALAQAGVATFSTVNFHKAGAYTIEAVDGALAPIFSSSFNISAAPAARMVFAAQPPSTAALSPFGVDLELLDRFGNIATGDVSTVALSFFKSPTGAVLGGTTSLPVSGGFATFANLSADTAGLYILSASDSPLSEIRSRVFRIS